MWYLLLLGILSCPLLSVKQGLWWCHWLDACDCGGVVQSLPKCHITSACGGLFLRRGSSRVMADVAARLRIASCTMAVQHVLHICVPFSPEDRLEINMENRCWGFRCWQAAHFQEPRVLVWHCKQTLRSGFLVFHAAGPKCSFVCFVLQTQHCFTASQVRHTRYMLHHGF